MTRPDKPFKKRDIRPEDIPTLYELACQYELIGTVAAWAEALRLFKLTAKQGYGPAQKELASCYLTGVGVGQSSRKAVYWLTRAAAQGDKQAQFDLAGYYIQGRGVKQNIDEATRLLKAAAEQGYEEASAVLEVLEKKGPPPAKKKKKASGPTCRPH